MGKKVIGYCKVTMQTNVQFAENIIVGLVKISMLEVVMMMIAMIINENNL